MFKAYVTILCKMHRFVPVWSINWSHLWGGSTKYQLAALDLIERRAKRLVVSMALVSKFHTLVHR